MGFTLGPTVFLRNLIRGPHCNTAATLEVVATAALFTADVSADKNNAPSTNSHFGEPHCSNRKWWSTAGYGHL